MFFKGSDAVFGAGGVHGAVLPVDGGDILPIRLHKKPKEAWSCISLDTLVLLIALLAPRTVEGSGICHCCHAQKDYNQHAGDFDLGRQEIGGMEYWRNGGL